MKKSIILMIAVLSFAGAFAQSTRNGTLAIYNSRGVVKAHDTLVNVDTGYLWDGRSDNDQWNVSYQFIATELTGTLTPTMVVQGSNDCNGSIIGGTWYTMTNCTTCQTSLTNTPGTKNVFFDFKIPNNTWKYIRVRVIAGTTQTSIYTGSYWLSAPFLKGL